MTAVFVDLDRTLLRGPSGPVLDRALRRRGVVPGEHSLPGSDLLYSIYGRWGENLASMGLARAAAVLAGGWSQDEVKAAGEEAVDELATLVGPYAPAALHAHREAGDRLVLATTTPFDMISPLARTLGFEDVIATRYAVSDGKYTGRVDGGFVWGLGKLNAVRSWAEAHGESLSDCHAYSDSIYDAPLLAAVGHPHAINPDPRLHVLALARRWPVEYWDRPPGVPSIAGLEPYHFMRIVIRKPAFPYARFDIEGVDTIPNAGGVILVSNHRSYFDAFALALVAQQINRPVRYLAKREMFDVAAIGWFLKAIGGIPVDRGSGSGTPMRAAEASLRAGEIVAILPEGTIPRGDAALDPVLHGHTGAARLAAATDAPVIPIGLSGTEKVWPREAKLPNVIGIRDVTVRIGPAVKLGYKDAVADTKKIMSAISALIPVNANTEERSATAKTSKTQRPDR